MTDVWTLSNQSTQTAGFFGLVIRRHALLRLAVVTPLATWRSLVAQVAAIFLRMEQEKAHAATLTWVISVTTWHEALGLSSSPTASY
jgi:hypothetical protein